ncbi:MAG: glycosyltransferase family 2 protein [Bacteriovoracaceae bacterium]
MSDMSLIIPVHNEDSNILFLAREIEEAFYQAPFKWEVIWVNDASTDKTLELLVELQASQYRHKVLTHSKKLGQSAALIHGIKRANFPLIATIDGDGQNSPFDLLALRELLIEKDMMLVQGVRVVRKDHLIRKASTFIANVIRNGILGTNHRDVGCAVRVFRKEVINDLPTFKGLHRFLPVFISVIHPDGVLEYPVRHRARLGGASNYGVWDRAWVGIFDIMGVLWFIRRGFFPSRSI